MWTLKLAGVANAECAVTNNPSESMNAVFHRLQKWKNVPLDVIVVSMHHLRSFYHRKLERSMHQCGRWMIKNAYEFCQREPSLMPSSKFCPNPQKERNPTGFNIRPVNSLANF